MKDVVCIYSGGMDSFTLVNDTYQRGRLHSCISFDYGQRHVKELDYAKRVCEELSVSHHIVRLHALTWLMQGGSALMDREVAMPEGHYADNNMKLTVVPNRNMIMLSIAIAYAVSTKVDEVHFGAHAGDHTIYPDCRPEFIDAMDTLAQHANWHPVRILAPYRHLDKGKILRIGVAQLNIDYAKSWTCYAGRERACGKCGSCQERLEGFASIGLMDPCEYEV